MNRSRLSRMLGIAAALVAAVPGVASAAEVWPALTTEHIFPDSTKPATADGALKLLAARGEQEGGQVAVRPDGPMSFTPVVSDLSGPGVIPASKVQVYRVGYTKLLKPSTGVDRLHGDGRYGDALIPVSGSVDIPGGETTSFYVLVDIAGDAAPGDYSGTLSLGGLGSFPINLKVAPVSANRDAFPITARLHVDNLAEVLGTNPGDPAFQRGVYDSLLPMLRSRGISPGRPPMGNPSVDDASGALDFTNVGQTGLGANRQQNLDAFFNMGFPSIEVPFLPNYPTYANVEDRGYNDDGKRKATAAGISARYASVANRSYALVVDEPTVEEYAAVNRAAGQLRSASPAIPVMVTEAPSTRAVTDMGGSVDIWTPPLWDLYKDPAASRRVVEQGKRLWWYTYGSDTQRYTPNVLIDKSGSEPRLLGWLAQKEGIQGFFYWGLNNWGGKTLANPNNDPWYLSHTKSDVNCGGVRREVGGNGEASLIWPGPSPAQPAYGSLRLESLRDGAEDFSLLTQLQGADPAAYTQVMNGLSRPFTGTTDGDEGDACGDYARPGYLPVVEDNPVNLDGARRIVIARLSGQPLATLSGKVMGLQTSETGRGAAKQGKAVTKKGVYGAIVRFGTLETTTKADGSWTLTNVPPVPGDLTVSRDPEGAIDKVSVAVDRTLLEAGGGRIETPPLDADASRPVVGPGLGRFTAEASPARGAERAGTVTLTVSNKYNDTGESTYTAGGKTPSVTAFYDRTKESRAARNWSGYRYLDMTVQVTRAAQEGQRWYLIVTPGGHFANSRNLAIGRSVQNIRIDLRRPHASKGAMKGMNNVKYIRFGLQSALPKEWREGHSPTVGLKISNMRLVK